MVFFAFLQKLNFYYSLTMAFMPRNDFIIYGNDPIYELQWSHEEKVYYTDIEVEMASPKDIIFVGGSIKTVFTPKDNSYTNIPLRDAFRFYFGLRYDRFELGFRHYCTHPVALYIHNKANEFSIHGSYREIYLQISNR